VASRGPKGWVRPDERILDELCERIARSSADARDLEVTVEDGEVHLDGTIETEEELRFVVSLAERTLGVRKVHAEVRLREQAEDADEPPTGTWH
jgi:osmotically-inducible protein OsmY